MRNCPVHVSPMHVRIVYMGTHESHMGLQGSILLCFFDNRGSTHMYYLIFQAKTGQKRTFSQCRDHVFLTNAGTKWRSMVFFIDKGLDSIELRHACVYQSVVISFSSVYSLHFRVFSRISAGMWRHRPVDCERIIGWGRRHVFRTPLGSRIKWKMLKSRKTYFYLNFLVHEVLSRNSCISCFQ